MKLTTGQKKHLRRNPDTFAEKVVGITTLEEFQREKILKPIAKYSQICIKSCHSTGKTWSMGVAASWFLTSFPESIVVTTAPTYRQVQALLWGEIRNIQKTSKTPLGGNCTPQGTKWMITDKWYAIGYSPKKEVTQGEEQGKASSFQGFHSIYVIIVFDEATGIDQQVWSMAQGLLTSGKIVKWVCIGNPTTKNCEFYKKFQKADWFPVHLSCFDSPNLLANGFTDKTAIRKEIQLLKQMEQAQRLERIETYKKPVPHLISAQWAIGYIYELGMNHPLVVSKVFGEFPEYDENVIVQYSEVIHSQQRELKPEGKRSVGVDVARFGSDSTVFTEFVGDVETRKKVLHGKGTMEVTGELVRFLLDRYGQNDTIIVVDAIGIGSGVVDRLYELRNEGAFPINWKIEELHCGRACSDEYSKKKFKNLKAKMFWELREAIQTDIQLLDDSIYAEELPTIMYQFDSSARLEIESKDKYKARTGRGSPDHADSLALANYGREMIRPVAFPTAGTEETRKTIAPPLTDQDNEW